MKNLHGQPDEMERVQCSLRFNEHTHNFVSLLEYFRAKELFCDATIACDGKKYPVHQVILSTCSEFFADVFASASCRNPVVMLQDVSRFHIESLLTYIYTGEVLIPRHEMATFLSVAKSLYVKGLMIPSYSEKKNHPPSGHLPDIWHKACLSPREDTSRHHGPVTSPLMEFRSMAPRIQHRDEMTHYHLHNQEIRMNGTTNEPPFKRTRALEPPQNARLNADHLNRSLYMIEHPEDLRVSTFPPRRCSSSENQNTHDHLENNPTRVEVQKPTERVTENSMEEQQISKPAERTEEAEDRQSILSNYNHSNSKGGTFQELIAGDEVHIKEEPKDDDFESDAKPLQSPEDTKATADDDDDDEEEPNLQISDDNGENQDNPTSPTVKTEFHEHLQESLEHPSSPESVSRSDTSASSTHIHPPLSQLRKELLRPVSQHPAGHHIQLHHTAAPQSIPHPVIAMREPQPHHNSRMPPHSQSLLREPPPLMKILPKISELMNDNESSRPHSVVKDLPTNRSGSHLLVSAPPTYRSHSNQHHFSLEIHNQQLGPVLVNGGTHLTVKNHFLVPKYTEKSISGFDVCRRVNNEGPLNLSGGGNKISTSSPTGDSAGQDPFLGKILTNRKKRLRGPKSWEYLVRLLKDPTTNPAVIRWENRDAGIFRLVQPSVIAQRWGRRTGKHASESLTYENFARGLRYHYATGALKPVSEKSFVYRLGPKAFKLLEEYDAGTAPFI